MSSWGRLYRSLRDPLPAGSYRLGMSLQGVEQDAESVTAVFADGTRVRGDLLVGADGVRSTVREQFLPDIATQLRRLRRLARHAGRERRAARHPCGNFRALYVLSAGRRAVPGLSRARPQQRDPAPAAAPTTSSGTGPPTPSTTLVDLCTDATGRCHGTAIPPPLIRPEVTAAIKATARALVAPQVAEIFARTPQPFFQPIFDLESPQTVFGRVALLGDAAFVARPHVGAGVTKAALDAASLADAMADDDLVAGLQRYQSAAATVRQRPGRART